LNLKLGVKIKGFFANEILGSGYTRKLRA